MSCSPLLWINTNFLIKCIGEFPFKHVFYYPVLHPAFKMHVRNTFQTVTICLLVRKGLPPLGDPKTISGKLVRLDLGLDSWVNKRDPEKSVCWRLRWAGLCAQRMSCSFLHIHSCRNHVSPHRIRVARWYWAHRRFLEKVGGIILFSSSPATAALLCHKHLTLITSHPDNSKSGCDRPHSTVIIVIVQKTGSKPQHKWPSYDRRQR